MVPFSNRSGLSYQRWAKIAVTLAGEMRHHAQPTAGCLEIVVGLFLKVGRVVAEAGGLC
jgi:hypothetical protein